MAKETTDLNQVRETMRELSAKHGCKVGCAALDCGRYVIFRLKPLSKSWLEFTKSITRSMHKDPTGMVAAQRNFVIDNVLAPDPAAAKTLLDEESWYYQDIAAKIEKGAKTNYVDIDPLSADGESSEAT